MIALYLVSVVLGGVNIYGLASALNGKSVLMFRDERSAVIWAFILGLAMCGAGINLNLQNPVLRIRGFISGAVLGSVLLTVFISVLLNRPVPLIGTVRNGMICFICIMGIKMMLTGINVVNMTLTGGR